MLVSHLCSCMHETAAVANWLAVQLCCDYKIKAEFPANN